MTQVTRQIGEGTRTAVPPVRELPDPPKTPRSPGHTAVRKVAAKILRMTRRPMEDAEYAFIGSMLAQYRSLGRSCYLELVRLAELDSGRIAACDLAYSRMKKGEVDSHE